MLPLLSSAQEVTVYVLLEPSGEVGQEISMGGSLQVFAAAVLLDLPLRQLYGLVILAPIHRGLLFFAMIRLTSNVLY